jgi:uncharacterized protein (DUF1684 family)
MFVLFAAACGSDKRRCAGGGDYQAEIKAWRHARVERLQSPTGWLSLAGLFWLSEGQNSFGSDDSNDVIFPAKAPPCMGVLELRDGQVSVAIAPDVRVVWQGQPVRAKKLHSDISGTPTVLEWGSLSWHIIERQGRLGLRLKDSDSPRFDNFNGVDNYPIQAAWNLPAKLERYHPPKKIAIGDITGGISEETCPGALVFDKDGQTFRLEPVGDGTGPLFVMFADQTSGVDTYGAGRFLYVELPDSAGKTCIDFNKAYNPPCAFTPFATCPLPPPQNRLALKIMAGEKYHGTHEDEL